MTGPTMWAIRAAAFASLAFDPGFRLERVTIADRGFRRNCEMMQRSKNSWKRNCQLASLSKCDINRALQNGASSPTRRKWLQKKFCSRRSFRNYDWVGYAIALGRHCESVLARTRRNQTDVHRLELEFGFVVRSKVGFRCFEPVLVVALGEVGFVMRASGL